MDFSFLLYPLNAVYLGCTFAVFGAAVAVGGRWERLLGICGGASTLICVLVDGLYGVGEHRGIYVVVTLPLLGGFLALALRRNALWPLFAAAFQLLSTMVAFAAYLNPHLDATSVATAGRVWDYLLYGTLVYGLWARRSAPSGPPPGHHLLTATE